MGMSWRREAEMVGIMTPSYVRRALATRQIENNDLIGRLERVPILLSYGAQDGSVTNPMAADLQSNCLKPQYPDMKASDIRRSLSRPGALTVS